MTITKEHAQNELDILIKTTPDAIIAPFKKEILALCEAFGKSGQSGGSAPYVAHALSDAIGKLLLQQTVAPLTGEDDEWIDQTELSCGEVLFQNKRAYSVFKGEDGKAYCLDAIVFDGDIGGTFTSNGNIRLSDHTCVSSRQYIKSFPFTPKTFHVDVKDHRWESKEEKVIDPEGDWWTHTIIDESQLKEVFDYYDRECELASA